MVQLKIFKPVPIEVTEVLFKVGVVMLPLPLTTVQEPVPTEGVLPFMFKVGLPAHKV